MIDFYNAQVFVLILYLYQLSICFVPFVWYVCIKLLLKRLCCIVMIMYVSAIMSDLMYCTFIYYKREETCYMTCMYSRRKFFIALCKVISTNLLCFFTWFFFLIKAIAISFPLLFAISFKSEIERSLYRRSSTVINQMDKPMLKSGKAINSDNYCRHNSWKSNNYRLRRINSVNNWFSKRSIRDKG